MPTARPCCRGGSPTTIPSALALVAGWFAGTIPADARIAAIFPDGPQRYLGTVYDDDYCAAHSLLN